MELRHLRYFVAIAEERSFTRAAERLWVAQPGLSTQIRRLEAELGARLFERHARGVDLTEAGALFLERARAALAAADAASSTGSDLKGGLAGTLTVGLATPARWNGYLQKLRAGRGQVALPHFSVHFSASLIPSLKKLGMGVAFGPGAHPFPWGSKTRVSGLVAGEG